MTAKDLKASILQLAIQGKLVPQDPNDEPAEVLLARIECLRQLPQRTQRAQRGAKSSDSLRFSANFAFSASAPAGKNPVNPVKKYPPVTDDEKPFDLPANWTWVRWGDLSDSIQYGYNAPAKAQGRIKMVRISDVQDGEVRWSGVPYCDIPEDEIEKYLLKPGDILFARTGGTVGKSYIVREVPEPAIYAGYLIRTRYSQSLCADYFKYFMESQLYWSQLHEGTIATAQPNCNGKTLARMLLPLPPLAEQKRIVAKIEELMPLVERYAAAKAESDELEANLPDAFRKSVLQQAVEGKLVPQDPNDEPAEALLARIECLRQLPQRTQRAQRGAKTVGADVLGRPQSPESGKSENEEREANTKNALRSSAKFSFSASAPAGKNPVNPVNPVKKYPPVTDDEKPFDLPANWTWCRLGEIVFNHGQKTPESQFSYIDIGSIDNKRQRLNEQETLLMPKEASSRARKIVEKGDIIYSCVRPYLHNMAIIDRDFSREPIASTGFAVMATMEAVDTKYLFYYLLSPVFDDYANDTDNAKGVAYPAISDAKLYKAVVPLPPLAEQKRIVAEVERLLALGEKLRQD